MVVMWRREPVTTARGSLGGALQVLASDGLALPSGFILIVVLTRWLGPADYGVFAVASALVVWIEWGLGALLNRPSTQLVSATLDWRPLASGLLRLHLAAGALGALGLIVLAGFFGRLSGNPSLAFYICLFSIDVPLFCAGQCHRTLLVGTGAFGPRALAGAGRHVGRLVIVTVLVAAGMSVSGAILGSIGATLIELLLARWFIRPRLRGGGRPDWGRFWRLAMPLFLFGASLRLFERMDLFMLQVLIPDPGPVGSYGAAATAAGAVGMFGVSLSPLLLSVLTNCVRDGDLARARCISKAALRSVCHLLPVVAVVAASASEISDLTFGPAYVGAGPILGVLLFAAIAFSYLSLAASILISAGRSAWAPALSLPMLALALVGHLVVIPRWGPMGAAEVTVAGAALGVGAATWAVGRIWAAAPPALTLIRVLAVTGLSYYLAGMWVTAGAAVLFKIATLGTGSVLAMALSGEWSRQEMTLAWSWMPFGRTAPGVPTSVDR
jgi:O-antigen/teichoic acid export membrane protein